MQTEGIEGLLDRLTKASFTGELAIRCYAGKPTEARLVHELAYKEFEKPLPVVEAEPEFALKG